MREIYIGNGTTEYHLHSLTSWIPSVVDRGVEGLDSPAMRIDAYDNPGIAGQTIAQVLPGGSLISLEGRLRVAHQGDDTAEAAAYLEQRRLFKNAVTSLYNDLGRAQPLLLRFTDLAGRELQVECFQDRFSAPFGLPTRHDWRLQLRNPRGVIESQSTKTATVSLPVQGGVVFDIVFDIVFGDSSGGTTTATNDGSAEAKPIIKLHGPMTNPIIRNNTTGEFIGLTLELLASDVVTIDTQHQTIIQGDSTNRMGSRMSGSVLWSLQPGVNDISISADFSSAGFADITWRDTYGGL